MSIKLIVQDDGLFLLIPEQVEENSLKSVRDLLFREGFVNIDYGKVEEGLNEHCGQLFKISDTIQKFDKDEYIIVNLSDDEMIAYLTIFPPEQPEEEGQTITVQEIEYKLRASGVVHGINQEEIQRVANTKVTAQRVLAAQGTPSENGKDAHISYKFDTELSQTPIKKEDGSVDFYQLNLIKCVEKGQLLAERVPPTVGKNGFSVTGKTFSAEPGKDIVLKAGNNTELDPSQNKLFAKSGGHVYIKQDLVNIENIYVVKGDVDFSTGNINFLGDVIIQGDVRTGFEIHAGGDIKIKGSVEGAKIESSGGSILVNESIQGANRAELFAEKDIKAKFACNCKMKAINNIVISKYIAHSFVEAGEDIDVSQIKGTIFGGQVKAGSRIIVNNLGNESGTRTEAIIEDFVSKELRARLTEIEEEIPVLEKEIDLGNKAKQEIDRLGASISKVSPTHRTKLFDQASKAAELTDSYNQLVNEKRELQSRLLPRQKGGKIDVKGYVYPNVQLHFDNLMFEISEKKSKISFYTDGSNIKRKEL